MAVAGIQSFSINGTAYLVKSVSYKLPGINQKFLKALQQITDVTDYDPEPGEIEVEYYIPSTETASKYNSAQGLTVAFTQRDNTQIVLKNGIVNAPAEPNPMENTSKITISSPDMTEILATS
ncbi:hypothetical protein [Gluconacetobacter diazotrophicus]|uniref:hypothetical protein n=1 Tax=Gluconacetobacter diazotrophicus TaxID=33996 RepID=UPI0011AAFC6A|nr:hypothetical protein [Gluconacetobacter diazotrophicus]